MNLLPTKLLQAIQVSCYIAYHASERQPLASAAIAEHYGLKKRALEAVLQQLKRANILHSIQGQLGGYFMRDAVAVTLADIANALIDEAVAAPDGFEEFLPIITPRLDDARAAWMKNLSHHTIADLCQQCTEAGMPKLQEPLVDYAI